MSRSIKEVQSGTEEEEKKRAEESRPTNLSQALADLEQQLSNGPPEEMLGTEWSTKVMEARATVQDGRSFDGTFYHTTATKGKMAVMMTNVGSPEPGVMKVGVKFSNGLIFSLVTLRKTKGHDFFLKKMTESESSEPPSASYGVFRTPDDNYAENYAFNYSSKKKFINCSSEDAWIADNNGLGLVRTHSPKRRS